MNINTKKQKKFHHFRFAMVAVSFFILLGVVGLVYHMKTIADAQGGGTPPSSAVIWIKNGLPFQVPNANVLYDSLFGSLFLYNGAPGSGLQDTFRRSTFVLNAHKDSNSPTGYTFDYDATHNPATEFQNAALVADQHLNIPLVAGAPLKDGKYYRVRFKFRAGPNGGDNGADPQKNWNTDGGFSNRGVFAVSFLNDGSATDGNGPQEFIANSQFGFNPEDFRGNPLKAQFTTAFNNTYNTHGDPRCFQPASGADPSQSWCTWQSGTWKMNKGPNQAFQAEDPQQLMIRSGSTLDDSWFVGELQLDDVEVFETDQSGCPMVNGVADCSSTAPVTNLVRDPDANSTFQDTSGLGVTTSTSQVPSNDYISFSTKLEKIPQPNGQPPITNGFLSYVSKNYYIISANPNDPQSYPLFQQAQVLGKDCAKDGSGQRFFQRFDAAIPCYSNSNAKLAQGTAVFDEKINSPILVSSVYLKTKVISNVCQDGTISKPNNQIQIHQFTQLNHYHDINGNNSFDGYGVDSKISQLQNGSTDTNILTDNNADTKVDCSNPDFRIRAIEPNTNACFTDSPYTGSPQIALDFLHVGSYNEFRVRREATPLDTNQWTAWQPLAAANVSGCSSNPTNIFKDLNFQNRDKGLKNVGVQFGNKVGGADIEGPTLFDDIVYGYPWISTFRGDVHTNGELDGEASSLPPLSAFSQYSHYSCNPPNARFNADYVVSAVNGLQVISGVDSGNICKNGEEATPFNTLLQLNPSVSPGTLVGPDAQGLVNAIADLNLQAMSSIATMVCAGDITVTSNGSIVGGANGCSPQNQQLLSAGNLVFVQGAITVGNGETVLFRNSGNPSDSAAYTFVATDGIHVEDNVEYENGASQLSSSRQLASVAFLSNGNIDISESVNHLAGIYFTKGTLSTSNNPTAPKLSLYGSLVADKIDFNRNWLGPTQ